MKSPSAGARGRLGDPTQGSSPRKSGSRVLSAMQAGSAGQATGRGATLEDAGASRRSGMGGHAPPGAFAQEISETTVRPATKEPTSRWLRQQGWIPLIR